ncbi:MAG: ABC transporter ATP-binding protein [Solirubrobacterales bacterium]
MHILELKNVSQDFGGLRALDSVSLAVEKNEIFGLIGPNGAGKTTLFNLVTGIYKPTAGALFFAGKPITGQPPYRLARKGIARTFQNIRLFKKLSVIDNVRVGMHGVTPSTPLAALLAAKQRNHEERRQRERARELLDLVGLADRAMELADSLPYGEQRRLEIARALALNPSLLLLDEPAAGMNAREKEELLNYIRQIRDLGVTILLVEHDMNVVMNICERISVLDYGRKIAEGTPDVVRSDERVIQSYLGKSR